MASSSPSKHSASTAKEPSQAPAPSKRPNAFAELMSARTKKPRAEPPPPPLRNIFKPRNGLILYIDHPEQNPEGRVVEYDDDFVVIRDKFPKASVHLLLLPRNKALYKQHPLELLSSDAEFLAEVKIRVARLKTLVASELRRKYGSYSASDAPFQSAMEELMSQPDPPPPEERAKLLPPGRDYEADVIAGVHTHPSMNHMHIHILSRDMHSGCVKHKKHYLSFQTSFLVTLEDFPLEEDSPRFKPGGWPTWNMVCWRCGKDFKNKMTALKEHLEEEFEEWKKE